MILNRNKTGFTLIELLIVVAIIAILAAIAIPNFLLAQVKSKVARVKKDLQSIATGLESYYVDNNEYPYNEYYYRCIWRLTSPIAYMTKYPNDIFGPNSYGAFYSDPGSHYYFYWRWKNMQGVDNNGSDTDRDYIDGLWFQWYGYWGLCSFGPDNDYDYSAEIYDPTNGTISNGDHWRKQHGREGH